MPTFTTHYNIPKPLVNDPTDQDLWGGELNSGMDIIDSAISAAAGSNPTGTVIQYAAQTPPVGFLECNGIAVSRTTYATLFALIGVLYGVGDGSTTFNLPDMRGNFARGWDDSAGVDPGRVFGSTQADSVASHTHIASVTDPTHNHGPGGDTFFVTYTPAGPGFSALVAGSGVEYVKTTTTNSLTGISVTNATFGGTETRPKNVALLFCIKT